MQLTTLSDQIRLERRGLEGDHRGLGRGDPLCPIPRDYPSVLSLPAGFAFQSRDGLAYTLRRVTSKDAGLLEEFLRCLSAQTRWLRFMTARPWPPEVVRAEAARMLTGCAGNLITLIVAEARSESVAAVAELFYTRESEAGEVGVVVMDDAQRKGIGSLLLRQLVLIAQELGLTHLHGDMFAENYTIQRLIMALQLPFTATTQAGETHIIVRVPK